MVISTSYGKLKECGGRVDNVTSIWSETFNTWQAFCIMSYRAFPLFY